MNLSDQKPKYPQTLFNVVLIEPLIPQNTGNIGRTCCGMWSHLHLVEPMAFKIDDTKLKRAGLDYWPNLHWEIHPDWQTWLKRVPDQKRIVFFETKQNKTHFDQTYEIGDWLVFGKETKGIPEELLQQFPNQVVSIPFPGKIRSFNVSNAVSIGLAEAYRQTHPRISI